MNASAGGPESVPYELTLFVNGASERSARAIANARELCDRCLAGQARLVVVDMRANPAAVAGTGVIAAPTLLRTLPLPPRRLVGDLSDLDRVLRVLELERVVAPR